MDFIFVIFGNLRDILFDNKYKHKVIYYTSRALTYFRKVNTVQLTLYRCYRQLLLVGDLVIIC
jgi:hypothetical protein